MIVQVVGVFLLEKWRRERDLNPRYPSGYARFRGACLQPLGHLSAFATFNNCISGCLAGSIAHAKEADFTWACCKCITFLSCGSVYSQGTPEEVNPTSLLLFQPREAMNGVPKEII